MVSGNSNRANNSSSVKNVALLGAGYISEFHFAALRNLPNVNVTAICDLNRRQAEQFARERGIPNVYADLTQMLETEDLDVVHVLTPPHVHFPTAAPVLEAGVNVLIEKPLCHKVSQCQDLRQLATTHNQVLGISHNFLYFPVYEQFFADLSQGRLGQIDQIDIVWNKELGQLKGGPFSAWMLQTPTNILFEVAPHSFIHVAHLIGKPDSITVSVNDKVTLPGEREFYRRWEIMGWKGNTSIRVRLSFIDGYSQHYIHVRGTNASAYVDFENNTYVCNEHTPYPLDLDRFVIVAESSRNLLAQATGTLKDVILSKMGLAKAAEPFAYSIARTVDSFYQTYPTQLDDRLGMALGQTGVELAEWVASEANISVPEKQSQPVSALPTVEHPPSTVLVIGGTGFIGQVLVRQLSEQGYGVRVLSRNPASCPDGLRSLPIEIVKGDFADAQSIDKALDGIEYVYHLAKGNGNTWDDYLKSDVEPTQTVAELCLQHGVKRLLYTSSIAIYYAGKDAKTITEATPPHSGMLRVAPYARSKAESEKILLAMHQEKGLPVVIFRPGVVLGKEGNPYHWGITAWPYSSVCRLWGDGNSPLPIVLVEDVADAMVKALSKPEIDGRSYNLASKACITPNDYLDEFERHAGIQFKRIPTSAKRYYIEALAKWVIKWIGRDPNAAFPSYADCDGRSLAAPFDTSKARKELDWTPTEDRETLVYKGIHEPVDVFFK